METFAQGRNHKVAMNGYAKIEKMYSYVCNVFIEQLFTDIIIIIMTVLRPLLFGYSPSNFHSLGEGNQFMYILICVGRFRLIERLFGLVFTAVMPLNPPTHHRGSL